MNALSTFINKIYLQLSRGTKRWIFRSCDLIIFILSVYIAFVIRFDFFEALNWIPKYQTQIFMLIPVKLVFFSIVGIYRPVLRYAGFEFLGIAFIASLGSTGLASLVILLLQMNSLPRSILIMDSILTLFLVVSVRVVIRWLIYYSVSHAKDNEIQEKVIIYGAGEAGSQLLNALSRDRLNRVVAFVDDNFQLHRQVVGGITVHSPSEIKKLAKKNKVDAILLAMPGIGKLRRLEIIENIKHLGVTIKTIPGISEIVSGKVSITEFRKIDIVDLLGRDEVALDNELLKRDIKGKTVMITGAGGSIGSELTRQIAMQHPKCIILYEQNEYALYSIDIEIEESYPNLKVIPCLGSVLNDCLLKSIIQKYGVHTIYHTAAYKHVPLIEHNINEGIINNIKGTLTCVKAASDANVETFVLISTDKAVRPTNVMGATKRVAELILQAFAKREDISTRLIMVRFGNVLDSAGSVVPRFRKQIEEGRNLTITDKNMKRFFMSIPEAARLVIQAGAMGTGGDVFLLDMGKPVRIHDLAVQMIELSGLRLGEDIDIDITGVRPGEKLFEELLIDEHASESTSHSKIFKAQECSIEWEDLSKQLEELFESVKENAKDKVLLQLKKLVPEFNHCPKISAKN